MSTPLLKTKLHIPSPLTNTIIRRDLFTRLDVGLGGQLTLVAAPAGFGKSTLISNWARDGLQPVAWVSLDSADNDPALFWAYVVSGFQTALLGDDRGFREQINIAQLPPIKTLLTQLINILAERDEKIILVLDDYHIISNPQIHKDLAYLIENQPPSLHIVLLTRADPPLPIPRLRGRGLLTEVRAADLRFTIEDTEIFLNERMRLGLSDDELTVLSQRTEGWIIGLQLAAISMQGRSDKHNFIADFSGGHHFILEYLTEEVLDRVPETLRKFLLQTAILDQFNASLCDRVIGLNDSASQLDELQYQNLFIVPLDNERIWFRYHHLFRDLLKNRLGREYSPEDILGLYRRASQWYKEKNELIEAINYRLFAQDYEQVADLIEHTASGTMLHGRLTTLLGWIEALPETMLDTRPRLRFYQGWAYYLGGQPKIAEKILSDAKSYLEALPDSPKNRDLRGELAALLTGVIVYTNDPPRIIQEAKEALTYLSEDNLVPRARVLIALGTAYSYSDNLEKSTTEYRTARDLALRAKNPFLATAAIELLAGMQIYHLGELNAAQQNLAHVFNLGKSRDGTLLTFTGTTHILLAAINLEWNNLNTAASYLTKGFELIQQGGIGYSLTHAYCTKARLHLAQGEPDRMVKSLQKAEQATQDSQLMHLLVHNFACQVKLSLNLGDIHTAAQWTATDSFVRREFPEILPAYLQEVVQITEARVHLAMGDMDKTLGTLDRIYAQAKSAGRMAHVIEIYLLKTLAYQKRNNSAKAIESLKYALSLAAPQGYQRIFLEAGKSVYQLLRLGAFQNINTPFISRLLTAFDGTGTQRKPLDTSSIQIPTNNSQIEPLSERECEVLKLIAAGYTNQQIADALVVSLNTIKKHTTHIYGKMGVNNRTQAIAKAREIKLIT